MADIDVFEINEAFASQVSSETAYRFRQVATLPKLTLLPAGGSM